MITSKRFWAACMFAAATLIGFSNSSNADDKIDTAKLAGKWELVKGEGPPPGTVIEFTADQKVVLHLDKGGKSVAVPIGTYKVDGDKVTLMAKKKDGKDDNETNTITTLTDTRLVLVDSDKKVTEFKRQK